MPPLHWNWRLLACPALLGRSRKQTHREAGSTPHKHVQPYKHEFVPTCRSTGPPYDSGAYGTLAFPFGPDGIADVMAQQREFGVARMGNIQAFGSVAQNQVRTQGLPSSHLLPSLGRSWHRHHAIPLCSLWPQIGSCGSLANALGPDSDCITSLEDFQKFYNAAPEASQPALANFSDSDAAFARCVGGSVGGGGVGGL